MPSTVSFTVTDPNGNTVAGTTSFDSTDTVATFTPTSSLAAGTTYTVTISGAKDSIGQTMMAPYTYTFTTSKAFDAGGKCPCTIWPDVAPSGVSDATDTELGWSWASSSRPPTTGPLPASGSTRCPTTPARTPAACGVPPGPCWPPARSPTSPRQGWEELDFSSPVSVTAGTTYVASYHTSAGHYADTPNGLASAVTNGPLTALASGGVYAYGSSSTFPSNSFNASNYWVDVVFTTPSGVFTPTVTSVTPGSGSSGNPVTVAPTATFSQAVVPSTRVVHAQGLQREHGGRLGELRQRRHGRDLHALEPAGGRTPPTRPRCRGPRPAPARR